MKRSALLLFVAPMVAACGGKIEDVSSDPTTGSQPTPTTTTTAIPPSPGSPGAPGAPTQTPPKDPSPTSIKTLTAVAQPGGRDHVMVFAADGANDTCIRIHLAFPSGRSQYPSIVVNTKEWGVEGITRSPGAKRCGPGKQPPAAEDATDAKGNIDLGAIGLYVYPCTIDVHVAATFGGKPTLERIDGDEIAVEGCK